MGLAMYPATANEKNKIEDVKRPSQQCTYLNMTFLPLYACLTHSVN